MANRKATMTDLRMIIREFAKGTPMREIERKLNLSRTSLRTYKERAEQSGKSMQELQSLEDAVIGKQKCSDFGKMICSKIGNNGTMFSATRVQYYWQQCCSTSKGSIFLIYSSFFQVTSVVELAASGQLYDAAPGASV